jgi:hypothetical protein
MAIRRCPYCKAIIDEQAKYCDNCGTQLLFPEDEFVEEDIPGDRIINEEEETEKDEELEGEEKSEETGKREEGEEEEIESEEEKEETDEFEELKEGQGEAEEVEKEGLEFVGERKREIEEPQEEGQEREEEEPGKRIPTGEVKEKEEAGKEDRELQAWMELKEEIAKKAQGEERKTQPQESQEGIKEETSAEKQEMDKKYEVSIEEDELVFKTKDLEKLTQTVEEGEKKEQEEETASETKEDLPPWVSGMKEAPPSVTPDREEEAKEEQMLTRQEWTTDSGIGIPEKVTQTTLPFSDTVDRKEQEEERAEGLAKEAVEETEKRLPIGFSLKLKAKCVDLIFITALWLISLAFTAGVIGVSFFKIIFGSPLPVFAFYLILLLLYFFLFLYFLGETLGDHYFSEED